MAKAVLDDIQESIVQISTEVMQQAGQDILGKIEEIELNLEQREQVGKAFETVIEKAVQTTTNDIDSLTGVTKEKLKEQLDNINILSEEMKEKISKASNGLIDKIHDFAVKAIEQAVTATTDVASEIMKQSITALKSIFKELGALLKGEKNKEQAMDGIKNAWKDAGQEVIKSAGQAQQSFTKKFSSNKDKTTNIQSADTTKSHVEKAASKATTPNNHTR